MPRSARMKSKTGIYHVMLRGINRQDIFEDEEDYMKMLSRLEGLVERRDEKGQLQPPNTKVMRTITEFNEHWNRPPVHSRDIKETSILIIFTRIYE
mgnify:CR=1 FL=1